MNTKRLALGTLAVYIFIFAFEWIFHGVFMEDVYAQMPNLWRPKGEMVAYLPFLFVGQLIFSSVFAYIFAKGYENKGIPEGFRYGCWIAMLVNSGLLVNYAVMPYSLRLLIIWVVATFLELGLAGAILAALYKPKA